MLVIPMGVRTLTITPGGAWFLHQTFGNAIEHHFGWDLLSLVREFPRIWRVASELADKDFIVP